MFVTRLFFYHAKRYAGSDEDLDTIREQYRFPRYNNIALLSINVEYKGHKGTAMFLSNTLSCIGIGAAKSRIDC